MPKLTATELKKLVRGANKGLLKEDTWGAGDPGINEIKMNSLSALDFFMKDGVNISEAVDTHEYEISKRANPDEQTIEAFYESLNSGQRAGFLSPYNIDEFSGMDLYKLKGHNAGFAIKDGNDIVSVHNNSDLSGLANEFMKKAKEVGGSRLDHFDGFLSGLYRKYGFTDVYEIYQWDEQYAPTEWIFQGVDVLKEATSVYSQALKSIMYDSPNALPNESVEVETEGGLKLSINPSLKYNAYKYGRPDVIMRRIA